MLSAYVLILTEVGKVAYVAQALSDLDGVQVAEDITGPCSPGRTRLLTASSPTHGDRRPRSAALYRRRPLLGDDLTGGSDWGSPPGDLLGGSTEEQARAVEGVVAYAGRYSFHGDRVVHHVELWLFPNWGGTDQQRSVERSGDRLILSARPAAAGGHLAVPRLVWERIDPFPRAG